MKKNKIAILVAMMAYVAIGAVAISYGLREARDGAPMMAAVEEAPAEAGEAPAEEEAPEADTEETASLIEENETLAAADEILENDEALLAETAEEAEAEEDAEDTDAGAVEDADAEAADAGEKEEEDEALKEEETAISGAQGGGPYYKYTITMSGSLNFYDSPDSANGIGVIGTIPYGTTGYVIAQGSRRTLISYDGRLGYTSNVYTELTEVSAEEYPDELKSVTWDNAKIN